MFGLYQNFSEVAAVASVVLLLPISLIGVSLIRKSFEDVCFDDDNGVLSAAGAHFVLGGLLPELLVKK